MNNLFVIILLFFAFVAGSSLSDTDENIFLYSIASAFRRSQNELLSLNINHNEWSDNGYIPQVQTAAGLITGASLTEAHGFYKVPFGKAPTGEMRFRHSEMVKSFPDGRMNASSIGELRCYQRDSSCEHGSCETMSEDCLILNIHVPKFVDLSDPRASPSDRLPVFFWIHGGGLVQGSATSTLFDGRYLSNITNTIVVSSNYRLGALGFLAVKDGDELICNQGLGDQQLALQWVQDHIEKFGGDKSKVTIAGTSAGAQSVMFHLMSRKSSLLFHRAILQSQPALIQYPDRENALLTTEQVLINTKCKDVQCLKNLDAYDLVMQAPRMQAQNILNRDLFGIIEPFRFVLDGEEFSQNPIQFVQDGGWFHDKPAIMGTDVDEMIFVPLYIPDRLNITQQRYEWLLKFLFGPDVGQAIADKYDQMSDEKEKNYEVILGKIATDGFFICPSRTLAKLSAELSTVFLYSFAHAFDDPSCEQSWGPPGVCGYVFHSSEVSFIFRTDPLIRYNFSENDTMAANQFTYYWGNFFTSGNPSSGDIDSVKEFPEWPDYHAADLTQEMMRPIRKNSLVFRNTDPWINYVINPPDGSLDYDYKQDICDFWDQTKYYVDLDRNDDPTTSVAATTTKLAKTTLGLPETTTGGGKHTGFTFITIMFCLILKLLLG